MATQSYQMTGMFLDLALQGLQDVAPVTIADNAYLASFLNVAGQAKSLQGENDGRERLNKLKQAENLLAACNCTGTVLNQRLTRIISGH